MYPQTVVPLTSDIHNHLRDNHVNQTGGVTLTGASYTANRDGVAWNSSSSQELNYEYSYLGDRYVKVTPYARSTGTAYYYNDKSANPAQIGQVPSGSEAAASLRWFKVEPIKWIILNANWLPEGTIKNYTGTYAYSDPSKAHANIELYAADVLMSGIAFNANNTSLWTNSNVKTYLNEVFYKEAFQYTSEDTFNESTIYNNTTAGQNTNVTGLNSNHLTDGSGMNPTTQKVYLLSNYELSNANSPYVNATTGSGVFKNNGNRKVSGTDYARAHNLFISSGGSLNYWTRSANNDPSVYTVFNDGSFDYANALDATLGQRPALQLKQDCFVEPLLSSGGLTFWECTHKP